MDADNIKAARKRCIRNLMDLISYLPDNLTETILTKLPLRDAARTCILSRRWRYRCVKLPNLILEEAFWQQSLQNQSQARTSKFESILFRILLLHHGPITNINLHIPKLERPLDIDMLVSFVVRNGVQSFSLKNVRGGKLKLQSSLFTCPSLDSVYIESCEVNFIPSTCQRFSNLTMIALVDVTISAQALERLVSYYPSLLALQLRLSIDIQYLEIISPSLRYFTYYYGQPRQRGILKLLGGSPDLEDLHIDDHCVKSLATCGLPTILPTGMLHSLKSIDLFDICLEDMDRFSSVLCLIRSSPNLQKLKVDFSGIIVNDNKIMENLQDEEDYSDLTPNHLVDVEMLSVTCQDFVSNISFVEEDEYQSGVFKKLCQANDHQGDVHVSTCCAKCASPY